MMIFAVCFLIVFTSSLASSAVSASGSGSSSGSGSFPYSFDGSLNHELDFDKSSSPLISSFKGIPFDEFNRNIIKDDFTVVNPYEDSPVKKSKYQPWAGKRVGVLFPRGFYSYGGKRAIGVDKLRSIDSETVVDGVQGNDKKSSSKTFVNWAGKRYTKPFNIWAGK